MLVLSRKNNEAVVVEGCGGPDRRLIVTVLDVARGRVKLGFDVAADVAVHRREVWERMNNGGEAPNSRGRPASPKPEADRWEDDGGGAGVATGLPATHHAPHPRASGRR